MDKQKKDIVLQSNSDERLLVLMKQVKIKTDVLMHFSGHFGV